MKRVFLLIAMALILSIVSSTWAADFNVANELDLHNALTTAADNDENDTINIASGTYNTAGNTFSYTPSAVLPEEDYSLTIAGAGIGNTILNGGNSDQVMNINTTGLVDDTNTHITITGITFQNGNLGGVGNGGGLYVIANFPNITVKDCQFKDNTNSGIGGGAYCWSTMGTVTFTNNILDGNSAVSIAGGAYVGSSSGTTTFTNNILDGNSASWAGGVDANSDSGTITFASNIFIDNTAALIGGGARSFSSSGITIFINNIFNGNTANQSSGGADSSTISGTVTFTNNTFSGNTAGPGEGGWSSYFS